ncbi:phosphomannomutase/phosphoglucomutase [Rickettsiales endosymbiont of Stachyamoeba lipophora]|uniref:phosphomannomutase/phosphoglucomutase n=1 Tax=Rickettsiales endosymbiont of Stachyamoeba lipophora TaxID=2486578 RepID=UPI000F70B63C|nr:phosphomannomutase/phosphoglucomutase [Rickettsiales endosymbiont of Stachyamoeba lipophora]AZL16413.1 phosphomannomutase/phosphoglucomutase [Rickettsiales endosymbiont of Stachyamoeba lipophora]
MSGHSSYSHYINPQCFREYDIRGEIGQNLFSQDAYYIGKAIASYVIDNSNNYRICIGCDGRLTSPVLESTLIDGIKSCGVDVISIGVCPTPMLYYATHSTDSPHGVMITGSHNPADHNGFKIVINKKPFFGDKIQKLYETIAKADYRTTGKNAVKIVDLKVNEAYTATVANGLNFAKKFLKVAWDPGHGSSADIVNKLVEKLPGKHFVINNYIDGNFPAHDPDPTNPKNLIQLGEIIKKEKCDLGIAFDGDADRLVALDHKGRMLSGDALIAIFARSILNKSPKARIITDIKASKTIIDYINDNGGIALMWKTGHSNIKEKMQEIGAIMAGEVSGHIFFADKYYGYDDGLYAAVRLIEIIANSEKDLAELVNELPKTIITPEVRIECADERKFQVINEIKERLKQEDKKYLDIDGIRAESKGGWWLIRASNTQAALVIRFEASTEEELVALQQEVKQQLILSKVTVSIAL